MRLVFVVVQVPVSLALFVLFLLKACTTQCHAFPMSMYTCTITRTRGTRNLWSEVKSKSQRDEDEEYDSYYSSRLRPETSFGSETVPEGQRPINEYLNLLRQPLFDWAVASSKLATRLGLVYAAFFALVCYPIAGATFTTQEDSYSSIVLLQKVAASNVGAVGIVWLLILRLYAGWSYVGNRLDSSVVEYEETGWYDGDFEKKSVSEQKRDKFLYQSSVRPVVERLKVASLAVSALLLASVVGFNTAMSLHPIFDEYNPDILERLQYDDKLADKAAMKSGGRPTYCDSRYYRALAGGGGSACN